jgi:hypothetical protein
MPKIVISYRRSDGKAITGRIFDRLSDRYGRASVFLDIDDIPLGVDFREHINEVLQECEVLVAVVGLNWLGLRKGAPNRITERTDPVRIEVEAALKRGIPVIPVLIDGATMPTVAAMPETLNDFAFRNAAEVDSGRDFHRHMDRLIGALDRILITEPRPPAPKRGTPPAPEEIAARLDAAPSRVGDYQPICAVAIENISAKDLDRCQVQVEQFSGVRPVGMPMPLVLRTDGQIRNALNGRFMLSAGQPTTIPIVYKGPVRKNEWFFFDETGAHYLIPANPTKVVLGIYGGKFDGKLLVFIDTDAGWQPTPSMSTVANEYRIWPDDTPLGPGDLGHLTDLDWPALSDTEKAALTSLLHGAPPRQITIFVEDVDGRSLGASFIKVFRDLGWTVKRERSILTLQEGITILPDIEETRLLKTAIESSTTLQVQVQAGRGSVDDIYLTIGYKPE